MPNLPSLLADIPLRVSFVPMRGCVHFCSFCADNSGKRVDFFPYDAIRKSICEFPFPLRRVALYNSCDALAYRWHTAKKLYTIVDIALLFKQKGCNELLISSPGIAASDINRSILKEIASDNSFSLMLSFNREHALSRERLGEFFWTAKEILKYRRLVVRLVYCSPGEKDVLLGELQRMFGQEMLSDPITNRGVSVETVPAAPIGRGRFIYFNNAKNNIQWKRPVELMILSMFRNERALRDVRYIAKRSYEEFLQHAAVQFSGMFIFLFIPDFSGGTLVLKMTDVGKIVRTRGASIATHFHFDRKLKKFVNITSDGANKTLDLLLFDVRNCILSDFIRYIESRVEPENKRCAAKVFAAIMASDIVNEKCAIGDAVKMIPLNEEYVHYLKSAFECILEERGIFPRNVRSYFPVVLEYLRTKGEII